MVRNVQFEAVAVVESGGHAICLQKLRSSFGIGDLLMDVEGDARVLAVEDRCYPTPPTRVP
jgi:hypothetical protein